MSLVRQLRDEVVNPTIPASVVLRKGKILAATLQHSELQEWLTHELNGYPDGSDLPAYRRLVTTLLGVLSGPFGASASAYSVPVSMLPDSMKPGAKQAPLAHSLREIESSVAAGNDELRYVWPTEGVILARDRIGLADGWALVELYQPISLAQLEGVIDVVRNRFLDFLLGLQELNTEILDSERALAGLPKDRVTQILNLTVYGDHNVIATDSEIGQAQTSAAIDGRRISAVNSPQAIQADGGVLDGNTVDQSVAAVANGDFIRDSVVSASALSGEDQETLRDVIRALQELATQLRASDEPQAPDKEELLEHVELLRVQALTPREGRISTGVLKSILDATGKGLAGGGSLAEIWSTWGPQIASFFGIRPS